MESGGVGDSDVQLVPRVSLDEEARDVRHRRHVDEAPSPVLVLGTAEVPGDTAEDDEVVAAVGSQEGGLV